MHPRPVHDADYRATMTSTSPHPNPGGLCRKCADCPALCNGTELQLKLIALPEASATILSTLTTRQQPIMQLVIDGHPSKNCDHDPRMGCCESDLKKVSMGRPFKFPINPRLW